jgi:hypothetical protein
MVTVKSMPTSLRTFVYGKHTPSYIPSCALTCIHYLEMSPVLDVHVGVRGQA